MKTLLPLLAAITLAPLAQTALSAPTTAPSQTLEVATAAANRGFEYLRKTQHADFSWGDPIDPPGVSALVLKSYVEDPHFTPAIPFLGGGYDHLLGFQLPNGGIYKDLLANYNTAIAISALAVSRDPAYVPPMKRAIAYLRTLQWTDKIEAPDGKKIDVNDPRWGGFGYGSGKTGRPDLSNTQWALEALHDAGVPPTDPAFQAALKFATRCQNDSETNDQKWAGDDGGFVYLSTGGGAGGKYVGPDGRVMFRSYGSMTYAGLKSMIYCGLSKDDPRVKAAWGWVENNYTVDANPGMAETAPGASKGGLYYYYYTMAKALHAYGQPIITDSHGIQHDWRADLAYKLAQLQRPDGSWVGDRRWMESNPALVTSYACLALDEIRKDVERQAQ
ncbi:MAG TPA: prenyltransferase/squalene oxidase repeat-containing protein [Tepidisphaeraceae bacterium]|nr:prenyltransferase/squalene oxidase repeat-containing protein [Tepidisphaeraceae bacterium]